MTDQPLADWSDWLTQHGPALILLARQYVPSHADAEDVVHEAFLAFWRSPQSVADRTAYLYSCVRNTALNWLRTRKRRLVREVATAQRESLDWFTTHMLQTDMLELLAALPVEQREVVVMKIWGRLTFPQIGESLGLSANTAASRYRYALDKLRTQLAMETSHE